MTSGFTLCDVRVRFGRQKLLYQLDDGMWLLISTS